MELNSIDVVIGALLPPLISFLSKQSWPGAYKTLVAFGVSVAVGIIHVYLDGKFDLDNFGGTIFLVVGAAQVAYTTLWRPLAGATLDKLEQSGPVKDNPVLVGTTPDVKLPTGYDPDNQANLNK
jgi:hypothetical protein